MFEVCAPFLRTTMNIALRIERSIMVASAPIPAFALPLSRIGRTACRWIPVLEGEAVLDETVLRVGVERTLRG